MPTYIPTAGKFIKLRIHEHDSIWYRKAKLEGLNIYIYIRDIYIYIRDIYRW